MIKETCTRAGVSQPDRLVYAGGMALATNPAPEPRAIGALSTQLTEAVRAARAALAPHAEHLTAGAIDALDTVLAELERRRIRIAIYGEVKAGKSTLLNALAGGTLSPVAFEPLTSIPVRVTYGPATVWRLGTRRLESVAALEQVMRETAPALREVVVETDLDLLQLGGQVDLVDTPGVGSEAQFDAVTADTLRGLDAVILVVRYPALFTQFTRHLADQLRGDIGKLFVVWNLDPASAELPEAERRRHADALNAKLPGAHELHLVNARAAVPGDRIGQVISGIAELREALVRFATSSGRDVAAVREAAKRAHAGLGAAHQQLAERQTALDLALAAARGRLQAVDAAGEADTAAARARLDACHAALAALAQAAAAQAAAHVAECRAALRGARWQWVRRGDAMGLDAAVRAATQRLTDAMDAAARRTVEQLQGACAEHGTAIELAARPRSAPPAAEVGPAERLRHAVDGSRQLVRRALFQSWYLPGLTRLDREVLAAELAAQGTWLDGALATARAAAQTTCAGRIAAITERHAAQRQTILDETQFAAHEQERAALGEHLPIVAAQYEALTRIAAEARWLLGD
jgi:signal recognition particle receptor subunit beta